MGIFNIHNEPYYYSRWALILALKTYTLIKGQRSVNVHSDAYHQQRKAEIYCL